MDLVRDQSEYIVAAVDAVKEHLVLGALLAALIVLLFLRNFRLTLIAAVAIPTSHHRDLRGDVAAWASR